MTFFGLIAAYIAGKLLDALVTNAQNSPAATGRVSPPPRHPASSRRSTPHVRSVPRYNPDAPFQPGDFRPGIPDTPILAPTRPAGAPSAAPWPQVVPQGLGAFPGPAWVPDDPVSAPVVQRAQQLLPVLWAQGAGSFKVEQTAGRWIAYQAQSMGTKKGVVAFRQAAALPASGDAPAAARASSSPATMPASTSSSSTALPVLRRGSKGPEVKILQGRLGIAADGSFGPGTENAVRAFQRSRGLSPDGVVGPATWGALLGQQAA